MMREPIDHSFDELLAPISGPLIRNSADLTPQMLKQYPVWLGMLPSILEELVGRVGADNVLYTEASRVAYTGPLPYPTDKEDGIHLADPLIACDLGAADGASYQGSLTYTGRDLRSMSIVAFAPYGRRPSGRQSLTLGEIQPERYDEVVPRWRDSVEAAFGKKLRDLFPMKVWIDPKLLPPGATTEWTLPGLIYLQNEQMKVVAFD